MEELNTTKALRPRGTKTVAKPVVDAKMKVLRIPAEHWNFFCLLLKIEGICRLKSATQSVVCFAFQEACDGKDSLSHGCRFL